MPETLLVIAFRSNCMPVTMKKIGMNTPKPTASRRGCISCLARGPQAIEATRPAANAPSTRSRCSRELR